MTRIRIVAAALAIASVVAGGASVTVTAQSQAPKPDLVKEAFQLSYNLDHQAALETIRRAVALNPDDARAQRGLASILWLHLLFERGAASVDHYLGTVSKEQLKLPQPNAAVAAEFQTALSKAIALAEARIKTNPNDIQAQYDAGAAYGLQASYVASVEGSVSKAFGMARKSFQMQERVLERDPSRVSAGLIVGTYRYIVSTQTFLLRFFASMVGLHGDKAKGIALIEGAARDPESYVDAQAALMLIYSREGRHGEVITIARALSAQYPRNRLFVLEEGAAAIRAGRAPEADTTLTRGLAMFERDSRAKLPGEHALWLYKRGLARLNRNLLPDATADLQRATQLGPTDWVRGRVHVETGKIADLSGRRPDAMTEYRAAKRICKASADESCEKEADRLMKRPFTFK